MPHLAAWTTITSATSAEPICRVFRSRQTGLPQARRRMSIEAVLTGSSSDREHQTAAASPFPARDTMVQIYNSAREKVGTSVQGLLHRIASRMPSYPDLAAFLPSSPFWIDSPLPPAGDDVVAASEPDDTGMQMQQQVYAETLSHALSQPLLMPFLERADRVEVQYATLLADLSNMAYEANKVDASMLAERHQLVFISSSAQPVLGPITRDAHWELVKAAHSAGLTSEQQALKLKMEKAAAEVAKCEQSELSKQLHHSQGMAEHYKALPSYGSYDSIGGGGGFTAGPLSPDIEYSLLLGSMDEMLPSDDEYRSATAAELDAVQHVMVQQLLGSLDDEWEARSALDSIEEEMGRAASRSMMLSSGSNYSFANGLDSMASCDDFWPGDDSASVPEPKQPTAPRLPVRRTAATPINIPMAARHGNAVLHHAVVDPDRMPGSPQAGQLLTLPEPPAAWFVADDPATHVRYIVIQGSTSFDHWSINLKFDPVIFEDPLLGVRIHRGVYEAALRMYDDLVPLVKQHLASAGPAATVSLSGHSLGGSLASVLMLLLAYRKVVTPLQLSPCYTFGAPAVFCAGGYDSSPVCADGSSSGEQHRCDACRLKCEMHNVAPHLRDAALLGSDGAAAAAGAPSCFQRRPVMEILGIPDDTLNNVMMHKDIVPRAFVCDYTAVAGLLKRWMPSFKDHSTLSLSHQHKSLYNFIGRVAVLRPDNAADFVSNDNFHPMLPDAPGLYKMREPPPPLHIMHLSGSYDGIDSSIDDHDQRHLCGDSRDDGPAPKGNASASAPQQPLTLRSALLQFMNYPHPLQTLGSYESYGPNGAISRFHNPDNYTKGLLGLPEQSEVVVASGRKQQREAADMSDLLVTIS